MREEERVLPSLGFGILLRRYRVAAGLSQEALAERARISANGISALERGHRRTPQRETLALLVRALGLDEPQRRAFEAAARRKPARPDSGGAATLAVPIDATRKNNLPTFPTKLVGRANEIAKLAALVHNHRLVTLTGAGGIGKTSAAIEVGSMFLDRAEGGVWLIELAPVRDPSLIISTIARALAVREVPNRGLLDTLVNALENTETLLLLDNCEHVVADAAFVADALLRGCPGLRILATSREPLRVAGERTYRLPSLGVPSRKAAARLTALGALTYGAVELFVERAHAVAGSFKLGDDNAPIIADICRRLDGIPLAIELAAARLTVLSPQQLRERLNERYALLTGERRDVLPRHKTLRALIDWSHDLLDERERTLFRRLGVFVSHFTLPAATAVGGGGDLDDLDVFDVLASLIDKSLVVTETDGEALRYRLLESTQSYACEKLQAAGEFSITATRRLRYLRDRFIDARARVRQNARSTEIDALLLAELEDVRAALDGFAQSSEPILGAQLLAAIDSRWYWIGFGAEGSARIERFISLLPSEESGLTAQLWTALARIASDTNPLRADEAATTAVRFARAANDPQALAQALTVYADVLARARAFADARTALAEAEALAPPDDVWLRLRILFTRAFLSYSSDDLDAAAQAYEQLRTTHTQLRNASGANTATLNLAEVEHLRGRTDRAVALAQELLPALRVSGDDPLLSCALANLCGYLVALECFAEAREVAREAFGKATAHDGGDNIYVSLAIEPMALVAALGGEVRRAAALAGYTQDAFARVSYQREGTQRTTRTRLETVLRDRLVPAELDQLLNEGAALTRDKALALASASLEE